LVTALTALLLVLALFLLDRIHDHRHRPALHRRSLFDVAVAPKLIGELIKQPPPNIGVSHFTSPEPDRQFNFVARVEEPRRLAALRFKVMSPDLRPEPDLLQIDHMLMSSRLAFFPALFVPISAEIHQPANRWYRVGRNFDEIEPPVSRHFESIAGGNYPDLLPLFVNQPDLSNSNTLVDASLNWSGNGSPPLGLPHGLQLLKRRDAAV
jgi:hypothetical protein